jgi:hypothetical protein
MAHQDMGKAIDKILANKFIKLMEENAFGIDHLEVVACEAQRELTQKLTGHQQALFNAMDDAVTAADTVKLEKAFRIGFLEGMKVGVKLL